MNKPNNYDNTKAMGENFQVKPGGHKLVILQVKECQNKKGKPQVVVLYDFAPGDEHAGVALKTFNDDVRPEKKWPHFATAYVQVEDKDGNTSRDFKTFCTSVEHSNPGFEIAWGDGFEACFKKKLVGAVFGEKEDEYNGRITVRCERRWFCSADKAKDAPVPDLVKLPEERRSFTDSLPTDRFVDIPEGVDDEDIPFN